MNKSDLAVPGDILFYRVSKSTGLLGRITGILERIFNEGTGTYYHVSVLDETLDYQYEAVIPKTRRSKVDWNSEDLEVWRIVDATQDQIYMLTGAAKMAVGEWYGLGKSLSSLLRTRRLRVCTQFVVDAAVFSDIDLQQNKSDPILSPDELSEHPSLYQVAI